MSPREAERRDDASSVERLRYPSSKGQDTDAETRATQVSVLHQLFRIRRFSRHDAEEEDLKSETRSPPPLSSL